MNVNAIIVVNVNAIIVVNVNAIITMNIGPNVKWHCKTPYCNMILDDLHPHELNIAIELHRLGHKDDSMARAAYSINVLREQVNKYAPNRDKASDGVVGDSSHLALGNKSDHNPWYNGIVTAVDIDHDPTGGMDCKLLSQSLVYSRDPRIKYIIFNAQIYRMYSGHSKSFAWGPYSGVNAHRSHMHLSIVAKPIADDVSRWNLWFFNTLRLGSWNDDVRVMQAKLNATIQARLVIDGKFGPKTELAVRQYQAVRGLFVDGIVGPQTKGSLGM